MREKLCKAVLQLEEMTWVREGKIISAWAAMLCDARAIT
jgi:hypothetical protein